MCWGGQGGRARGCQGLVKSNDYRNKQILMYKPQTREDSKEYMALLCSSTNQKKIMFSTDYVFRPDCQNYFINVIKCI